MGPTTAGVLGIGPSPAVGTPTRIEGTIGPLQQVKLDSLMARTIGRSEVAIALLDGPVMTGESGLRGARIRHVGGESHGCVQGPSEACMHGTFVAGMLVGGRDGSTPGICPGCSLLVRPIFADDAERGPTVAVPSELARAVVECVDAGARVVNLSISTDEPSVSEDRELLDALGYATRHNVLMVAAAGNQGAVGSSTITRYPGVIPVVACDSAERPMRLSNLSHSMARYGLGAPGEAIEGLGVGGRSAVFSGTSAAVPFVTGAVALLWSLFPSAMPGEIRSALTRRRSQTTLVPPLLDATAAYESLARMWGDV